ncbi:hypothetical protein BDA99DRAFT_587491 [Phascolomyces articulosus]|uniref:Uncharacterized protein n=1 Tax=Phascolomyces articulosus TaxID=60185 RepID=A0AAD5K3L4_9FUNG|nr:hypothetical protein BDA99DRAFT_587491 [Phascolomyces articulosus]
MDILKRRMVLSPNTKLIHCVNSVLHSWVWDDVSTPNQDIICWLLGIVYRLFLVKYSSIAFVTPFHTSSTTLNTLLSLTLSKAFTLLKALLPRQINIKYKAISCILMQLLLHGKSNLILTCYPGDWNTTILTICIVKQLLSVMCKLTAGSLPIAINVY